MNIKAAKCGEGKDENSHWEIGALYQYRGSSTYYRCLKIAGEVYIVSISNSLSVYKTAELSITANRKLSKGECVKLTVE